MARMEGSAVFVDTNILIYAALRQSPLNPQAKERLKRLGEQGIPVWISRQVIREFLAAMTRSRELVEEVPLEALLELVHYLEAHFLVADEGPHVTARLLELIERIPVRGKQVHDANVVATMLAYDVHNLLTHNTADFARYSDLITVLPLE
jgi:predicted nucleic acid-binding protein